MTASPHKQRLVPAAHHEEAWRSLQPVVEAELSWGSRLEVPWSYDVHNDTWTASLQGPLHVERVRERFELAEGIKLEHRLPGWSVMDTVGRVYLHSHDVGVITTPDEQKIDTSPVSRFMSWLDRKLYEMENK